MMLSIQNTGKLRNQNFCLLHIRQINICCQMIFLCWKLFHFHKFFRSTDRNNFFLFHAKKFRIPLHTYKSQIPDFLVQIHGCTVELRFFCLLCCHCRKTISCSLCNVWFSTCIISDKCITYHSIQHIGSTQKIIKLCLSLVLDCSRCKYILYLTLSCQVTNKTGAVGSTLIICISFHMNVRITVYMMDIQIFSFANKSTTICTT